MVAVGSEADCLGGTDHGNPELCDGLHDHPNDHRPRLDAGRDGRVGFTFREA